MQQSQPFSINSYVYLPTIQFPQRKFKILQQLEQGGRGYDYLVLPEQWNIQQNLILKILKEINENEKYFIQALVDYQKKEDQLEINQRSQIIRIFDLIYHNEQHVLIMENSQDNLHTVAQNLKGTWSLIDKVKILKQISQSINFLHQYKIIHRDIKPENFVKVGNEYKLTNFCFVKQIKPEVNVLNTVFCGSRLFNAPEIRNGEQNYSFEIDIWSLGATFYEVLTELPFSNDINPQNITIKNNQFQFQENFITQNKFKELLSLMLDQNPLRRLKINQVIEQLEQIESLCKQSILRQQNSVTLPSKAQFGINPTVQSNNIISQPYNNFVSQSSNQNNFNNNIKQDIQQCFQEQNTQQNELFQKGILQLEVNLKKMIEQQTKIIKEQKITELESFKQEQSLKYDQIKSLVQDQKSQISQICSQIDQNTKLINNLIAKEMFESKINELNLQIKESISFQKDIKNILKNNFEKNNQSQMDHQLQYQKEDKKLNEHFEALKSYISDTQVKLQDIHQQQLNKIHQEQYEIRQLLISYQLQQQRINFTPNYLQTNQQIINEPIIEQEIKKQNQVMQSINQGLQELKQENLKIINIQKQPQQQTSDEIFQKLLKEKQDLYQKSSEKVIQQITENLMKGINLVQECQKQNQQDQVKILKQIQANLDLINQKNQKLDIQGEINIQQMDQLKPQQYSEQCYYPNNFKQEMQKEKQVQQFKIQKNNWVKPTKQNICNNLEYQQINKK